VFNKGQQGTLARSEIKAKKASWTLLSILISPELGLYFGSGDLMALAGIDGFVVRQADLATLESWALISAKKFLF